MEGRHAETCRDPWREDQMRRVGDPWREDLMRRVGDPWREDLMTRVGIHGGKT